MRKRRPLIAVVLVIAAVAIWYLGRPKEKIVEPAAPAATHAAIAAANKAAVANLPPDAVATVAPSATVDDPTFEGIDALNAPGKTINDDLNLLNDLFFSWQTTFPHVGNPWGSNAEITTAFTGANKYSIALIPKKHPAINAQGELTDRWGTPFFFHQLSGSRMEIRSAGPDRKLHTPDDIVKTP